MKRNIKYIRRLRCNRRDNRIDKLIMKIAPLLIDYRVPAPASLRETVLAKWEMAFDLKHPLSPGDGITGKWQQ